MKPTAARLRRRSSYACRRWARIVAAVAVVAAGTAGPASVVHGSVSDTTITTFAGTRTGSFSGDGGPATAAGLNSPTGVAVGPSGDIYVADTLDNRVRRIDANGLITTVAGTGAASFAGDGRAATSAGLSAPRGVVVDRSANIYVADTNNHRIRRIDPAGVITTVAGSGSGFSGDGGPATAAKLKVPSGVSLAGDGSLLVADTANNRIRRVDPAGIISTVAGGGTGGLGDGGPATAAALSSPTAAIADGSGGFYIADSGDNLIRRVDQSGRITTFAGGGTSTAEGAPATSVALGLAGGTLSPGLATDPNGDLYLSDAGQHRVRRVTPDGRMFTVAGNGKNTPFAGDGGPAVSATLASPRGLAVPTSGQLLIADTGNNRVRAVQWPALAIDDVAVDEGNSGLTTATLTVTARSNAGSFSVDWATADGTATVADNDYVAASGTLHFSPGEWRKTISVQVRGDTDPESANAFTVHLTNSPYPDVSGTVTIRDDDGPLPKLAVGETTSVVEADTAAVTATMTVTKSGTTSHAVSVAYATVDGTATAPVDYLARSGTLVFGPAETAKTVDVAVVGNEMPQPDRAFTLVLSDPRDAEIDTRRVAISDTQFQQVPDDTATVTIVDNDVPRWTDTAPLDSCLRADASCAGRDQHTATTLWAPVCTLASPPTWCGQVLVAGGLDPTTHDSRADAELYDPKSGTWASTSPMLVRRLFHTATLLPDGRVLVVGGGLKDRDTVAVREAEIYDPATRTWTATALPSVARMHHTATLLADGTVLVVGGTDRELIQPATDSVELFDPAHTSWSHCAPSDAHAGCPAPLPVPRIHNAMVRLSDGRVLVAGGYGSPVGATQALPALATAVLYDPSTGGWRTAAPMKLARGVAYAVLLGARPCGGQCDQVLVVGGRNGPSAELYDPVADEWSFAATPDFATDVGESTIVDYNTPGAFTELADGRALLVSVLDGSTDLYDPVQARWTPQHADLSVTGGFATAVLDSPSCANSAPPAFCGGVLATGGGDFRKNYANASIFTPAPLVTTLAPAGGPSAGAAPVVISGHGFAGATNVKFGDVPAGTFHVDSDTQITAVAPPQSSGKVEVSVRTPFGGTSQHFPADLSLPYSYAVSQAPGAVGDLAARPASDHNVDLSWSAPASDGAFPPPAARYVVKASRAPITTGADFDSAPALCGGTCSFNAPSIGAPLTVSVSGLDPGTTYHFALRAVNEADMAGPVSNEAAATTSGAPPIVATEVPLATATALPAPPTTAASAPPPPAADTPPTAPDAPTAAAPTDAAPVATAAAPSVPTTTKAVAAPATPGAPPTTPGAPQPAPTTTTRPSESALGQSIAAPSATHTRVPTWMWIVLGISVFANLGVLGAVLSRRLHPPARTR